MENQILVILFTAALFLAMVLQLAAKPRFAAKITGACIVIAGVSGMVIYGYGFAASCSNALLAIVRALLAVCGMYVGKIDFSAVSGTPIFQSTWAQFYFYLVHLFALYATASAAITTVGAEALQKLRLWLARRGELNLIFGINPESLDFGKALLAEGNCSVLFVDKTPDSATTASIIKAGCALRSDEKALQATPGFLKGIGLRPGKRKVTLYAMSRDTAENLPYAQAMLASLELLGISPEQTSLVMPAKEDAVVSRLQVLGDSYGYGFVTCFQEAGLAARLLTTLYPPCDTIDFDENGVAMNHFESLIIGFGNMGQMVLRQLVMNGQFVGSRFRADVFAPDCLTVNGHFADNFEAMLNEYDICFHPVDAHSRDFYAYLREHARRLRYVVLCTGSQKNNREIAENLSTCFRRMNLMMPVYLCSYRGVSCCHPDGTFSKPYKLYQPATLSTSRLDRMAMMLNHSYHSSSDRTPLELWMECDYFSRMSCRASTDFVPAILRAAGKTADDIRDSWTFTETKLDTLGHLEHLRWNAFHFAMGYRTMDDAEFDARAAEYLRQKETTDTPAIRIAKNTADRTHACLIDWGALDALSAKERSITGKDVDYKREDIKNILALPTLLNATE